MIPTIEQQEAEADSSFLTLVSLIADKYHITYTVDILTHTVNFDCDEAISIPLIIEIDAIVNERRVRE